MTIIDDEIDRTSYRLLSQTSPLLDIIKPRK